MTTDPPPPRRNWHFNRWLIVLAIAMFGWSSWRGYAYRSAVKQARALGWYMEGEYTDPVKTIRRNWKAAFRKETWVNGDTLVRIDTSEAFEQNLASVYWLDPTRLDIDNAATLRDLSALKPLTRLQDITLNRCKGLTNVDGLKNLSALQRVSLGGCTGLTNVDALKNLSALQWVSLPACRGLTNVDGLKNLPALQQVRLGGCKGLTKESVAALKAALPNANITGP